MSNINALSDRLRPGVEAAPWVIEEVKKLEARVASMREVVAVAVTMLYDTHKNDVIKTFTVDDLGAIVKITEPLFGMQVEDIYKAAWDQLSSSEPCWCATCRPVTPSDMRMVTCPQCGNKRCPRANDHRNACTGSNEPGRPGSAYP